MTIFEVAIYQCASRLMRPDQRDRARGLAQRAEAGDEDARAVLKELALNVIHAAGKLERCFKKI